MSFRKLAEAVDVSHAAPLAHFPDRLSLDAALAAQGFREVRNRCESLRPPPLPMPAQQAPGPEKPGMAAAARAPSPGWPGLFFMKLVTAALVYLRFALEHPGLFQVMYAPELSERLRGEEERGAAGGETAFQELAQEKARAFELFASLVRQGQETAELRSDVPPDRVARLVIALTEGLAHQYLEEDHGLSRLKEAEGLFELLLRGFVRPPP